MSGYDFIASTWCGRVFSTSSNLGQGYAATCLRCYAKWLVGQYP